MVSGVWSSFVQLGTSRLLAAADSEWPWLGAPEYGEARAERNSVFARIWRNAIKCIIFFMIVLFRYQTVLCVILGGFTSAGCSKFLILIVFLPFCKFSSVLSRPSFCKYGISSFL